MAGRALSVLCPYLLNHSDYRVTVLGCHYLESRCSCCHVLVKLGRQSFSLLKEFLDYYYYATAGGARFWVCARSSLLQISFRLFFTVEEVLDNHANCTVCH